MTTQKLVYKSSWCTAEPIVYDKQFDETVDRFIGKIFANRTNRVVNKNGKNYYIPSDNYNAYVARMRKIR